VVQLLKAVQQKLGYGFLSTKAGKQHPYRLNVGSDTDIHHFRKVQLLPRLSQVEVEALQAGWPRVEKAGRRGE